MRFSKMAILLTVVGALGARAQGPRFASSDRQTGMLELFSSEGCSSCPPAEAWLSQLRGRPGLWKDFVPVAFPVDYWDYLGWKDARANASFTARQRAYAHEWGTSQIYTPEFVWNGRESGSDATRVHLQAGKPVGVLEAVSIGPHRYRVTFKPPRGTEYVAYGALLGNRIISKVGAGENSGRTLGHDFVALTLARASMTRSLNTLNTFTATVEIPAPKEKAPRYSLAFWVVSTGSQKPLQATGGDIEERW